MAEAAASRAADMRSDGTDRMRQIDHLVESSGLIEENVVGALNASFAFYTGLADGGAFPGRPSRDELLADVWAQEFEVRADTIDWIYGYLVLAYQPLSDDDLAAYIARCLYRAQPDRPGAGAEWRDLHGVQRHVCRHLARARALRGALHGRRGHLSRSA